MDGQTDSTRATFLLRLRDRSDQITWQRFHERYGELLYRYARSRGASAVDAEDIVQEVELGLFKALDGFEYDGSKGRFRAYLRMAVIHAMGRHAGKRARAGDLMDPDGFDHVVAVRDAGEDDQWEHEWRLHRLRWALREVAPEFGQTVLAAFQMHVLNQVPVEETAERLGMSKASVYQAKSRILRRVKEQLESLDPNSEV